MLYFMLFITLLFAGCTKAPIPMDDPVQVKRAGFKQAGKSRKQILANSVFSIASERMSTFHYPIHSFPYSKSAKSFSYVTVFLYGPDGHTQPIKMLMTFVKFRENLLNNMELQFDLRSIPDGSYQIMVCGGLSECNTGELSDLRKHTDSLTELVEGRDQTNLSRLLGVIQARYPKMIGFLPEVQIKEGRLLTNRLSHKISFGRKTPLSVHQVQMISPLRISSATTHVGFFFLGKPRFLDRKRSIIMIDRYNQGINHRDPRLVYAGGKARLMGNAPMTGVLFYDKNANNLIDTDEELLLDDRVSAKEGLIKLDSNGNKWIDPGDRAYPKLKVWFNKNRDSFVGKKTEIHSLSALQIDRISLYFAPIKEEGPKGLFTSFRTSAWSSKKLEKHYLVFDLSLREIPPRKL